MEYYIYSLWLLTKYMYSQFLELLLNWHGIGWNERMIIAILPWRLWSHAGRLQQYINIDYNVQHKARNAENEQGKQKHINFPQTSKS